MEMQIELQVAEVRGSRFATDNGEPATNLEREKERFPIRR